MAETVRTAMETEEKYRWNLKDLISDEEEWKSLIRQAEEGFTVLSAYEGTLGMSAETLDSCLRCRDRIEGILSRVAAYARQKRDENTADSAGQTLASEAEGLIARYMEAEAFLEPEIQEIPEGRIREWMETEPLALYRRYLERLLARKAHMLSFREERLLAMAADAANGASAAFTMLNNADLTFEPVKDRDGRQVPVTHGRYGLLMESQDREIRRDAFLSYYKSYRQSANTMAALFESNLKQACFYARARRYPSSRAYYLAENEIPEAVYDNLIRTVRGRLDLMHRYVSIRKKILGLGELHMYDMFVPLVPSMDRKVTYEEAEGLILEALRPLGENYGKLLKQGLEGRWVDVYERPGKRSGGYSSCVYGFHPYVLMSYDDTLNSVLTLAHEMGHSLHSWYSNEAQPYPYADYRIFVAEVASTCNEALLLRYLMEKAESRKEKAYLANQFLERFRGTMFRQTMLAEFELETHRMAWDRKPLTREVLCRLYQDLNVCYYGDDVTVDPDISYEWARIPHFYSPFYVYQYATGFAAAMAVSSRILSGDRNALSGYLEFLKGGCSMTPIGLLKLCGLDMEKPQVVEEALDVFESLLDEFEKETGSFAG